MIGKSKAIKKVFELIEKVANNKTNVLITGESGVGKELVARAIHFGGKLKENPFVAVNCGAIPETLIESELFGYKKGSFTGAVGDKDGLFKVAHQGTIFLDEVGELPMVLQVKLLRVLQDKTFKPVGGVEDIKVDVRVICATNKNLENMVANNTFREDLYYRLNVIHIKVPPLRERREDIPDLVTHFIEKLSKRFNKGINGISVDAMDILSAYSYPGNIRELENIIERAMALEDSKEISIRSLPSYLASKNSTESNTKSSVQTAEKNNPWDPKNLLASGAIKLDDVLRSYEKQIVLEAGRMCGSDLKKMASLLGLSQKDLKKKI